MHNSKSISPRYHHHHHSLKKLKILFRFMDTFVFLTIISRFSSTHLPINFSTEISSKIYTPIFAFLSGNAIILLLLFKSRLIHENRNGDDDDDNGGGIEFYDAYFKSYEKRLIDRNCNTTPVAIDSDASVIVSINGYKKICRSRSEDLMRIRGGEDETYRKLRPPVTVDRRSRLIHENRDGDDDDDDNGGIEFYDAYFRSYEKRLIESDNTSTTAMAIDASVVVNGYKKICRSRSEDLMRVRGGEDETYRKLRPPVTVESSGDGYAEDEMSGEEFRRTVEAFIARQQKSLRDEEVFSLVDRIKYLN